MFQMMLKRLTRASKARLMTLAVIVGLLTGASIAIFQAAIELFHEFFSEFLGHEVLPDAISGIAIIITLALAGLIVGLLMDRFIGHERHHGVAGVMESVALMSGRLRYRRMPFKALASAISLGAGASVGPEDPSVQIGSNLGSWVGHWIPLNDDHKRLLVAAGAASAIAAAFNAPIAGVFFALEVILNSAFETRSFGVIVLAAVISSAFTQAIHPGSELGPFFYELGTPLEIVLFVPLSLGFAFVAALFIRAVSWQHDLWEKHVHLSRPLKTALAGVLVGVVALFLPQIMGPGEETMNAVLNGEAGYSLLLLALLGGAKLLMTSVSIAGGFVGGVFAPALFIGIMLGSAYGQIVNRIFPAVLTSDAQTYAIAGMAAMLAGVVRAPITAILLVFELTNDYRLILPIMLTAVLCVFVTERFEPDGIYMRGLKRKGVHLSEGREIDVLQAVRVEEVMRSPAPVIEENASLSQLRDALRASGSRALCVVGTSGTLSGIVTLSDLQRAYAENGGQTADGQSNGRPGTVGTICTRQVVTASQGETLSDVIGRLNTLNISTLPVIEPNSEALIGLFNRESVINAYKLAQQRRFSSQEVAQQVRLHHMTTTEVFNFQVLPESSMDNRKIADLMLPKESIIVAIKRGETLLIPRGETTLSAGDWITMVAPYQMGESLKALAQSPRN